MFGEATVVAVAYRGIPAGPAATDAVVPVADVDTCRRDTALDPKGLFVLALTGVFLAALVTGSVEGLLEPCF